MICGIGYVKFVIKLIDIVLKGRKQKMENKEKSKKKTAYYVTFIYYNKKKSKYHYAVIVIKKRYKNNIKEMIRILKETYTHLSNIPDSRFAVIFHKKIKYREGYLDEIM